ncbi:hypothetical protein [Leptospira ilyithenensis]|uniref:Uncharacterized protein n=1 Tax=Leptospira ilyithenensis TaxID=2484901 RepID=A0A4R9LN55_9LEPT|nr:hypothetical protein [Leptospira ilyithenensis]TGN08424.1 hypothetical protein EHS11_16135 [Leptospira ilyithenensis]
MGILLLIGFIFSFLVCESFYFSYVYHADNLYLPLFVRDILSSKPLGWYLPPSSYFFPDGLIVYCLSLFFPKEYIPSLYGAFLFPAYLMILYGFFRKRMGRKKSILSLLGFVLFFSLSSVIVGFAYANKQNPLGLIYANGHHVTGFMFSFYVLFQVFPGNIPPSLLKNGEILIRLLFVWIFFGFVYASDRLILVFAILPFVISSLFTKRKETRIHYLLFFILVICTGEWILFSQVIFFPIESSFSVLLRKTDDLSVGRILFLFGNYYFDFFKLFFNRASIFFLLPFCIFIFYFFIRKNKKQFRSDKRFLIFQGILSLLAAGIIARFVYEHPYPIRYFLPFTITLVSFISISCFSQWNAYSFLTIHYKNINDSVILLLGLFSCLVLLNYGFTLREEKKVLVEQLKEVSQNKRILTNYKTQNPLQFWSKGKIKSYPVSQKKKPYFWITNAFPHPFWNPQLPLSEQITEPYLEWIPNSLTKDF